MQNIHFIHYFWNIQYYNTRPVTRESQDVRNDSTEYCFWQICVFPETTRTCWVFGTAAPSLASLAAVLMATASLSPPAIRTGQRNEVKQEKHTYLSKNRAWSIVTLILIFNTCIITISRWSVFEKSRTLSAFHEAILSYQCVCRPLT